MSSFQLNVKNSSHPTIVGFRVEGHFKEKSAMRLRKVTKIQEIRQASASDRKFSSSSRRFKSASGRSSSSSNKAKGKGFNGEKKISFGATAAKNTYL